MTKERKKENNGENFKFEPRDTRQVLNKLTWSVSVFKIPIFLLFLGNQIGLIVIHSDESVSFECSFQIS